MIHAKWFVPAHSNSQCYTLVICTPQSLIPINPANITFTWYEFGILTIHPHYFLIVSSLYPMLSALYPHHTLPSLFISSLCLHCVYIICLYHRISQYPNDNPLSSQGRWFRPFAAQELATPEGRRRWATGAVPPNAAAVAEAAQRPFEEYVARPW